VAWRATIAKDAHAVAGDLGYAPILATVIAPGDPSSAAYARAITRSCAQAGVGSRVVELPNGGADADLVACLLELNVDDQVHGIIVQLPLPPAYTTAVVGATLAPEKDVDGVTPMSAGLLALGCPSYVPATALGGMELLRHHGIGVRGMRATVVGRSAVVGRPLAMLLIAEGATVTVCHTATRDLGDACRNAEILFVAAGRRGLVDATMVTPGAVVVDFGTTVDGEGRLHGDVHFPSVSQVASWISPVPGGTLPMTTVALLHNTVKSARWAVSGRAIARA
jgi:methylenetetrahydrofolate dehydrogenase (NADP+)/methenyltetrahydrofolate cyclohydrolase